MRPSPDQILDYHEYPILYVDDEPENLRIFELTFRREFSILTAPSADAGLEIINSRPVALVLSDHRMPGMTGVEFLSRVRELDPKTIRMLVTAYGDVATLTEAINSGSIYRFVPKPWSPDELRVNLRRAIEAYALERDKTQLLRELTLLNRVSRSVNRELAFGPLQELVLDIVTEELGYDAASLLFYDADREVLSFGDSVPRDGPVCESLREIEIPRARAPVFVKRLRAGEVQTLELGHALDLETPVRNWATEVAAGEILVLPLLGVKDVVGALAVDNRRGGDAFDGDDRTLLEGLATQAVIAIENARLVEDLRRSREQILRADRLGTLGTLAAGLAHEINNPLVSIHTFLSMAPAKRSENDEEFWTDYHALACNEVDRIRRLVETMRELGRGCRSDATRQTLDVSELAREVVQLLEREAQRVQVRFELTTDAETPKIVGVRDHLHQVLLNLLLNAIHATPAGDAVELRVGVEATGGAARIEVTDHGPGIPEEHLERIFDPFFTTKDPDQGTGLGLMICHRIVADHEGSIEVRSKPGEGATFSVLLPAGPEHSAELAPPR